MLTEFLQTQQPPTDSHNRSRNLAEVAVPDACETVEQHFVRNSLATDCQSDLSSVCSAPEYIKQQPRSDIKRLAHAEADAASTQQENLALKEAISEKEVMSVAALEDARRCQRVSKKHCVCFEPLVYSYMCDS